MKNFYILSFLIILSSCNIKEAFESLDLARESETLAENIPEDTEDDWQFKGVYSGGKEGEYNQKLTFKMYLWQLNNKFEAYIYYFWYVTDFNYSEYQSLLIGTKNRNIILKGSFDDEPVLVTIHDSIQSNIEISVKFLNQSNAIVDRVSLSLDYAIQDTISTPLNGERAMKEYQAGLMQTNTSHRGL